jgi:EAL domain-containing protein (putative c-di-GMP-specific phosphodiesterase class I)
VNVRVLALDEEQELVVDQTTEQVRLLMRVKQVLKERALVLYAQPIQNAEEGYHEILTRMRCGDSVIMPDQFIPLIVQFNLSQRFDMLVLETCSVAPSASRPAILRQSAAFNADAKDSAAQIIALFQRYRVSPDLSLLR